MPDDVPSARPMDPVAGGTASWTGPYLKARALEQRLYSDQVVARLPEIPDAHPLAAEWRLRSDSARRLARYLGRLPRPLRVVEVGCGNGWLARAIAGIDGSEVVGLDGNELELNQATRVFGSVPNLRFVLGDATVAACPLDRPTALILASFIQYLPDLGAMITRLLGWLEPGGELHILDSPLYKADEIAGARERSRRHYERLGAPEMADFYYHHAWAELDEFDADVLYRPDAAMPRLKRLLLRRPSAPFPWIRIRAADRRTAG
jgi:SAM-dependent methyltransferase